jgi:hypothetical protein
MIILNYISHNDRMTEWRDKLGKINKDFEWKESTYIYRYYPCAISIRIRKKKCPNLILLAFYNLTTLETKYYLNYIGHYLDISLDM